MAHHTLKIWPKYYKAVVAGIKTFEVRDNSDRNFIEGDTVELREWNPMMIDGDQIAPPHAPGLARGYTGAPPLQYKIGYVLPLGDHRVTFSLLPLGSTISTADRAIEACRSIVKKYPEKVTRGEAADMAIEFKTAALFALDMVETPIENNEKENTA